ncbi:MAG: hypothetical protein ACYC46_15025 [Acidobacteriaceae bacterium]
MDAISQDAPQTSSKRGNLFGIPLGEMGWFASLLMALSAGFLSFFLVCFFAIIGILIINTATHQNINYADSYKFVALPAGSVVMVFSLFYMAYLWLRRKIAG